MTEQYISGYLEAISRVKDILTPNVGGSNQFFSITKNPQFELIENIKLFLEENQDWYSNRFYSFEETITKIELIEIENWRLSLE